MPFPRYCVALALQLFATVAVARESTPRWPDTPLARTQVLALLQTLNADLLTHDSATLTLERWCAAHNMATHAVIVATPIHNSDAPLPDDLRRALHAAPDEPVAHRRVALSCGDHVLSQADNWYLPRRLTPMMNATLARTDTPFGKVVQPLHFHRSTLSAQLLWSPLPDGWELQAAPAAHAGALAIPHDVLQHRAVLADAGGHPFAALVETYTSAVLEWNDARSGRRETHRTPPVDVHSPAHP